MKFSEYVLLDRQSQMPDPLGFMSPSSALQDLLFKQFTVLSNLPACHGLLALVYQVLGEAGVTPKGKNFALEFRKTELFWGVLHAVDTNAESVLNIRKYKDIMRERDSLAFKDIKASDPAYSRLSYGTLGHYSSPSTSWGILNKSGQQLTAQGEQLAAAFDKRNGESLKGRIDAWRKGQAASLDGLRALARSFEVGAAPSAAEARVWRTLIDQYCEQHPQVRPLWLQPLSDEELGAWQQDAASYADGFTHWRGRYASLSQQLLQIQRFEQLTGLVHTIFEREYLNCAEGDNRLLAPEALERDLAAALGTTASAYMQEASHKDSKTLFASLSGVSDYRDAAAIICAHHVAHQKSKGSIPFFEDGALRIRDKFSMQAYSERRQELLGAAGPAARLAIAAFQHRRDWHFHRASRYHRYAAAA